MKTQWTVDTNLRTPSPITAAFIDAYVSTRGRGGLSGIGAAVIAAQAKYGINATYIVAHAAHETGWGTARIAREKNNLFGWRAFDASPYDSATGFPTKGHCIDFVMGRVDALYLNPEGRYFAGATLRGMGVRYATDPQWAEKIAKIAQGIEDAYYKSRPKPLIARVLESAGRLMGRRA